MPVTLYPAIDLKGGACVRLKRGEMSEATVYADDPAAQARAWQAAGFSWLHVVDLDGAFAGESRNGEAVRAILGAVTVPVQLGGGIRDMAAIEAWLGAGITRVILGSAAAKDPALTRAACRRFPGRIVLGIDARDGMVATEGWAETGSLSALDLARRYEDAGAAAIIFTDIARDGMLAGLNLAATEALARAVPIPVIASGGVASVEDVRAVRASAAGIEGVILGRALYDGRLSPEEAIAAAA
ncbi:MAG: 1-(5-phosphoribosyl)-5-[(5-phosphoribosylamino)methylideneamino]imidazole-4-carboxamide isomerase [Acetobacteraceae bacterium]|jgi:phosphoribosylformimino-5-aminoimidazole carboxamide ribotide isomerase|nr:1-(5-phosphoribosyl)-5-[(5-phosphoribosylamino)methylideneamino]imidazole-4-carboxamide isomerase [Acetobacteraceae bacterium]